MKYHFLDAAKKPLRLKFILNFIARNGKNKLKARQCDFDKTEAWQESSNSGQNPTRHFDAIFVSRNVRLQKKAQGNSEEIFQVKPEGQEAYFISQPR